MNTELIAWAAGAVAGLAIAVWLVRRRKRRDYYSEACCSAALKLWRETGRVGPVVGTVTTREDGTVEVTAEFADEKGAERGK